LAGWSVAYDQLEHGYDGFAEWLRFVFIALSSCR